MTFTIGICDDFRDEVEILIKFIQNNPHRDHYETIQSTQPQEFLRALEEKKPDLVFLDIDLGGINGIQLGDMIKALCPDTLIVYITAHENYALEAFRVRAFHYLLKPITKKQFYTVLDEALENIRQRAIPKPEMSFLVKIKGEAIRIPYSEIFYFEKTGHRIKIHTKARDIFFYDKLSSLTDQLDASSFLRCHAGYIVNTDKIRIFREKRLILDNDMELPVSRTYAEQVRERLAAMLFEKGRT